MAAGDSAFIEVLLEHPAVDDVAVVGVPDPAAGEVPKAYVVTGQPVAADDMIKWVAARVAPYKKLRAVEFVETVPRSPSGKILRRLLRSAGAGNGGATTTTGRSVP